MVSGKIKESFIIWKKNNPEKYEKWRKSISKTLSGKTKRKIRNDGSEK